MLNDPQMLVLAGGLLLLGALVVWGMTRRRRTKRLRSRFGPEYKVVREQFGRDADKELRERVRRAEQLQIHPLPREERSRFEAAWNAVQARFVDDPVLAVIEADRLVVDIMLARGYPVADFDQRAADLSVKHPDLVRRYRAGREIARKTREGDAVVEEIREAMVHYKALVHELIGPPESAAEPRRRAAGG